VTLTTKDTVSIIVPVRGEEPYLPKLIEDLDFHLSGNCEIIIVTSDKVKSHLTHSDLMLITQENTSIRLSYRSSVRFFSNVKIFKSYGDSLERAILLGFSVAKGNKIIVMDADGSHPPQLILKMVESLDECDMVVASRFIEDGKYDTSLSRSVVSFTFNAYARLLGSTLTDPMSGFFGIRTHLLKSMTFRPFKWKVALEMNNKLRPNTKEIPYAFHNRKNGKSKSNWKVGLKLLWDITVSAL
jgi:dolichol-phosphate mannosyltransferase